MSAFNSINKLYPVSTLSRPKLKQIWHRPFWKAWLPMTASTVYETEISVSEMCSLVSADLWEKENTCVFYRFIEIRVEVLAEGECCETRATGKCFQSFMEFPQIFTFHVQNVNSLCENSIKIHANSWVLKMMKTEIVNLVCLHQSVHF